MKRKKKALPPRHKRMARSARLQAARHWIPQYDGENLLRGYKKHFGVDLECAIKELEMLGTELDSQYIATLRQSEAGRLKSIHEKKQKYKERSSVDDEFFDDDDCPF